ncbi:MAG TPA: SMP-30/gluconolactonase/LRE family protein [Blastocatellia bacterium]|nr:SMP-30/gluconolactonase/LRE family protein [Blastocatellia bacterium]
MRKVIAYTLTVALALSWVLLPGQAGYYAVQAQQATPVANRISPATVTAGGATFTVRIEGANFAQGARVLLDGVPLESSRANRKGKLLLAEIDSSVIANTGTHTIQAVNPGGAPTAPLTLTVVQPDSELQLRLQGNAVEEDIGQTLLVEARGDDFGPNTTVLIWGRTQAVTNVLNESRLTFEIPKKFTTEPGRIPIIVRRGEGRLSNLDVFFVVPAPARLSDISPASVEVDDEEFELRLTGENFKPDAKILIKKANGEITVLETTRQREGRLDATVPASFRSSPGQLIIRVEQDGVQSADEILTVSPDTEPFIFTVAPNKVRVGEDKETIDIVGANLGSKDVVLIDGEVATVKNESQGRITLVLRDEILASVGTHNIQVRDKDGNLSNIASFQVVPDVSVTTVAGADREGFNPDAECVSLEDARFRRPRRMAIGPDGRLYLTDQQNHVIRAIDFDTNQVCTIAGTGLPGYSDSGNAAGFEPTFSFPNGIAVDNDGVIYVTENGNNVIRRVVVNGDEVTVDTFAGTANAITDRGKQRRLNSTLVGLNGFRDGEARDSAFRLPDDIIIAPDGSFYVADPINHSIRHIIRNGNDVIVETIAGTGVPGFADGVTESARFNTPTALALSLDGNFLFVADTGNHRIRVVNLQTRRVETFAGSGRTTGDDGPAGQASFIRPIGLAMDSDGVLYVSEVGGSRIRRVDPDGNVTTLAGGSRIKFRDGTGARATFNELRGLAIDRQRGILYVADYENFRIRRIALR